MRKTISVAALLLTLTYTALAGDIQNDSSKPLANAVQGPAVNDIIPKDAPDSLTELSLDLLAVLPALF
jgi:hypothetical protein